MIAKANPHRFSHIPTFGLLFAVGVLVTVGLGLAVASSYAWPPDPEPTHPLRVINAGRLEDFAPGSVTHFAEHKFWLVRLESGEFLALSHTDPHRGCTVPWRPNMDYQGRKGWFRDPCGGSIYDMTGHRVFGPSSRDMDRFAVTVKNNKVIVDIRAIISSSTPRPDY